MLADLRYVLGWSGSAVRGLPRAGRHALTALHRLVRRRPRAAPGTPVQPSAEAPGMNGEARPERAAANPAARPAPPEITSGVRAVCDAQRVHIHRGEDLAWAGLIAERWPAVLLADGASTVEARSSEFTGLGAQAAETAIDATRESLERRMRGARSLERVLAHLPCVYAEATDQLRASDVRGATTLLVGLLWEARTTGQRYWCYAYQGDGYITLVSPTSRIDGKIVPQRLLSPQKVEHTAALKASGLDVPAAVGVRLHAPGDMLLVASDGIEPLYRWCQTDLRRALHYQLLVTGGPGEDWAAVLRCCPSFDDDATIGIIRTSLGA